MDRFLLLRLSLLLTILLECVAAAADTEGQFAFNGFAEANLVLDGSAAVRANGLLVLTNGTTAATGHALHPLPQRLRDPSSSNGTVRSFSTSFVFAIVSPHLDVSSHGMAFFVSASRRLSNTMPFQYLGLLNTTDGNGNGNGSASNHILAVELDTLLNFELGDIDANHVGIDVNSLRSVKAASAGYYYDDKDPSLFRNISLYSREAMQIWIDYDAGNTELQVAVAPLGVSKPKKPLLSHTIDLSTVVADESYVGFSSSTGLLSCSHYVLGWSFSTDGAPLPAFDVSRLPKFPNLQPTSANIVLPVVLPVTIVLALASALVFLYYRRKAYYELREDWETEFEALHITYKDLVTATKNFNQKHLIGKGGSGEVYKGTLPRSKLEVAVKRVSHESRSGMKEFLSEVASIGRLRHRNLVHLLGYCRTKRELFLVYEYMPNGSLDKYLYSNQEANFAALSWARRFHIAKCIASGLLYLHEQWGRVVVHRDIKASNVLLDREMNALLGDFGLARLYERGSNPHTTHVVGTMGYLAPELLCTGKATPATDVFAFGLFLLEIASGRRSIEVGKNEETFTLLNYVLEHWRGGTLVNVMDPRLDGEYDATEAYLILRLGILCSHPVSNERPGMGQVVQYLNGDLLVPDLLPTMSGHTYVK